MSFGEPSGKDTPDAQSSHIEVIDPNQDLTTPDLLDYRSLSTSMVEETYRRLSARYGTTSSIGELPEEKQHELLSSVSQAWSEIDWRGPIEKTVRRFLAGRWEPHERPGSERNGMNKALLIRLMEEIKRASAFPGETRLQGAAYILQELLSAPFRYTYVLYKEKPHCFDLSQALVELTADWKVHIKSAAGVGAYFKPRKKRTESLLRKHEELLEKHKEQIEFTAQWVCKRTIRELERSMTALYFKLDRPGDTRRDVEEVMARARTYLSRKEVSTGVGLALELLNEANRLGANPAPQSN